MTTLTRYEIAARFDIPYQTVVDAVNVGHLPATLAPSRHDTRRLVYHVLAADAVAWNEERTLSRAALYARHRDLARWLETITRMVDRLTGAGELDERLLTTTEAAALNAAAAYLEGGNTP